MATKKSSAKSPGKKSKGGAKARSAKSPKAPDPTSDAALLLLDVSYAGNPDMPVDTAIAATGGLARLCKSSAAQFAKVGIGAGRIDLLAKFGRRLSALQILWLAARGGVVLSAAERKLLAEAEALDSKMVAGGRWACRDDEEAQKQLSAIADGQGLADTADDLGNLVAFWEPRAAERKHTDITDKDLRRATELAKQLAIVAQKESANVTAARAIELRNRCFWAADDLAKELREAGRYAFRLEPKLAARFVSRHHVSSRRPSRKNAATAVAHETPTPPPAPN